MKAILFPCPRIQLHCSPSLSPHGFQRRTQWHYPTSSPLAQNIQSLIPLPESGFEVPGHGVAVSARKHYRTDRDERSIFQRGGQDSVLLSELERSEEGRRERASGGGENASGEETLSETSTEGAGDVDLHIDLKKGVEHEDALRAQIGLSKGRNFSDLSGRCAVICRRTAPPSPHEARARLGPDFMLDRE